MHDLITGCKLVFFKLDYVNFQLNICNKMMPVSVCLTVTVINHGNIKTGLKYWQELKVYQSLTLILLT